jgi:hypothetical protein
MTPSWTPTAADVSGPLHARTLGTQTSADGFGAMKGSFDAATTIPEGKVNAAITLVLPEVIAIVGDDTGATALPQPVSGLAKQLAVFLAAADLEAGTTPRQTGRDQTANEYWLRRAGTVEEKLRHAYARYVAGDQPGPADDIAASNASAAYGFGVFESRSRVR